MKNICKSGGLTVISETTAFLLYRILYISNYNRRLLVQDMSLPLLLAMGGIGHFTYLAVVGEQSVGLFFYI